MQRLICQRRREPEPNRRANNKGVDRSDPESVKRPRGETRISRFDAFKLCAGEETIAGRLDAAGLPRLADRIAAGAGAADVAWQLKGGHDAQSRPALTLSLEGLVPLICQRCLQPLFERVSQRTELLLARDEAELARFDAEEAEVVLAHSPLDAQTLVEDELLLSLPFAPRHEPGACAASEVFGSTETTESPLAGLAVLKKQKTSD